MPQFLQHAPQIGKTNSRNRQRPDVQMPQRVIKGVSLQDSIKPLHQSENPWKPAQKQVSAGEVAEKVRTLFLHSFKYKIYVLCQTLPQSEITYSSLSCHDLKKKIFKSCHYGDDPLIYSL